MQKKCNIIIRRSKTPRLLTSNMYVHVHFCNIYSAYICVYNAVTILFNQHFIIVGNTVGKSPRGILHSNPIYLVLKPLKLQNSWRIFDRPVSSMHCKYAEFACKLQKILPMTNKTCHSMQKKCNIVLLFKICGINRYLPKKSCSWSAKKTWSIKNVRLCRKNAISSSADPRTPRLLTSNIIQYVCTCMHIM